MNNDLPLISVIVPVYNCEEYIKECLDSILNQTYSNIEVIIVDDGSTDSTANICDDYLREDSRIIYLHQENRGVATARNKGLEIAKGKYVAFIDSDDYIPSRYIENMCDQLENDNSDIVCCKWTKKEKELQNYKDNEAEVIILGRDKLISNLLISNEYGLFIWNKLFKRELIGNAQFNTDLVIAEDNEFIIRYLNKCKCGSLLAIVHYYYRENKESLTHKFESIDVLQAKIYSKFNAEKIMEDILRDESEIVYDGMSCRKIRSALFTLYKMINYKIYDKCIMKKIKIDTRYRYQSYRKVQKNSIEYNLAVIGMMISPKAMYVLGRILCIIMPDMVYRISQKN